MTESTKKPKKPRVPKTFEQSNLNLAELRSAMMDAVLAMMKTRVIVGSEQKFDSAASELSKVCNRLWSAREIHDSKWNDDGSWKPRPAVDATEKAGKS
jgi:hypothetical protein